MEGLNKDLRWLVHSFINDVEERKIAYSSTVIEELNQRKLKRIVLDEMINGTRIVAMDTPSFPCGQCYMYGSEETGGFCEEHVDERLYSTGVITFRQYCKLFCFCVDPWECSMSFPNGCSGIAPDWEKFEIERNGVAGAVHEFDEDDFIADYDLFEEEDQTS